MHQVITEWNIAVEIDMILKKKVDVNQATTKERNVIIRSDRREYNIYTWKKTPNEKASEEALSSCLVELTTSVMKHEGVKELLTSYYTHVVFVAINKLFINYICPCWNIVCAGIAWLRPSLCFLATSAPAIGMDEKLPLVDVLKLNPENIIYKHMKHIITINMKQIHTEEVFIR